jgi:hypothetical protein
MSLKVNFNQLKFDNATPVVCIVKKFIFPVGTFESEGGGDMLIDPRNGEKIVDPYNPKVAEFGKGIVFQNRNESVSTAMSDGNSIFIVNDVSPDNALKIKAQIDALGGNPKEFTKAQTYDLLSFISDLGYNDIYSSDLEFHRKKFESTNEMQTGIEGYSYGRRNDRVEGKPQVAVYVDGQDLAFEGQAKTAGNTQNHTNGFLAVFDKASPEDDQVRSIDSEKLSTYALSDGCPIIPHQNIVTVFAIEL